MIEIFTVATHETAGLRQFLYSLALVGKKATVICDGEQWLGYCWRFKRFIEEIKQSKSETVMLCDGFDSLCVRPIEVVESVFRARGHPIMFSVDPIVQPEYWAHLNPGLLIADREALIEAVRPEAWPDHFNDMFVLRTEWAEHKERFSADVDSQAFFTQTRERRWVPSDDAAFVHAPLHAGLGNVKTWIDSIYPIRLRSIAS